MAAFLIALDEEQNNPQPPRPRIFRDRTNMLEMDDTDIVRHCRLTRDLILNLCAQLQDHLQRPTNRSGSIPVSIQITTALSLLSSGSFQRMTGNAAGLSQPSVSRIVRDFTRALCSKRHHYIKFPDNVASQRTTKQAFFDLSDFPNVLGAVDGCLIPIVAPSHNEQTYVCRKGYHAINIQAVCDSDLIFTDAVVKYPGRTHDAFIWSECALNEKFEQGTFGESWILGDSGYPLRPWLLTPFLHPRNQAEERYNGAQRRARNTIERAFGLLKSRFRCLHKTGGCLTVAPDRCCKMIMSCIILHNICVSNGVQVEGEVQAEDQLVAGDINVYQGPVNDGQATRARLVEQIFH